jgi:hypothetical protein
MPTDPSYDPTVGGERVYSGVSRVINDMEPDDLYGNDFPQGYIVSGDGSDAPLVTNESYDAAIAFRYGEKVAARAQAVRNPPTALPVFEDVQSKAPTVELDEAYHADVPVAEKTRQMFLRMQERWAENTASTDADGRLNFDDEKCVMGLVDAEIYRHPGLKKSISGAELKRMFIENKQLTEQMQILKNGARIRAEEARAAMPQPEDVQPFRTRQTLASIADASQDGKAFLVEQLGAVTQEDLLEVKTDISEIKEMLKQLTANPHLGNSQVTAVEVEELPKADDVKADEVTEDADS